MVASRRQHLNLRPPASEANALPLDYLLGAVANAEAANLMKI